MRETNAPATMMTTAAWNRAGPVTTSPLFATSDRIRPQTSAISAYSEVFRPGLSASDRMTSRRMLPPAAARMARSGPQSHSGSAAKRMAMTTPVTVNAESARASNTS